MCNVNIIILNIIYVHIFFVRKKKSDFSFYLSERIVRFFLLYLAIFSIFHLVYLSKSVCSVLILLRFISRLPNCLELFYFGSISIHAPMNRQDISY